MYWYRIQNPDTESLYDKVKKQSVFIDTETDASLANVVPIALA